MINFDIFSCTRDDPLTSEDVARLLFGPHYEEYVLWQDAISRGKHISLEFEESDVDGELVRSAVREGSIGKLPDTIAFKAFKNWLRLKAYLHQTSDWPETTLDVTQTCRHPIHPGYPDPSPLYCPVCEMEQGIAFLARIWEVWEMLGAPKRVCYFRKEKPLYQRLKKIWLVEKTRWANLVLRFEEIARREEAWEDRHLATSGYTYEELVEARSCMAALQFARSRCPNIAVGFDASFEPSPRAINAQRIPMESATKLASYQLDGASYLSSPTSDGGLSPPSPMELVELPPSPSMFPPLSPPCSPRSCGTPPLSPASSVYSPSEPPPWPPDLPASPPESTCRGRRSVTFAEDVFDHGGRPLEKLARRNSSYERGRHACTSEDGWEDTSFYRNDISFWDTGGAEAEEMSPGLDTAENTDRDGDVQMS